jgi:hypothetical protein
MADDEFLSFDEHRQEWVDDDSSVRCFRCGKSIPAIATRCPHCRVHFQGVADDFDREGEEEYARAGRPWWVIVTAVALLLFMIYSVFEFGLLWIW